MLSYSKQTLERVSEIVARVADTDITNVGPHDPLHLDSIKRIALIVELENAFEIEIAPEKITDAAFECLAALSSLIEVHL